MQRKEGMQRIIEKCPECGSTKLVHDNDTGETICGGCGLVLRELNQA